MAAMSPWGEVQYAEKIIRGVTFVSTARHGGLRIATKWAQEHIPDAVLNKYFIRYGGYYFAEEDVDMNLPIFFNLRLANAYYQIYYRSCIKKGIKNIDLEAWFNKYIRGTLIEYYGDHEIMKPHFECINGNLVSALSRARL